MILAVRKHEVLHESTGLHCTSASFFFTSQSSKIVVSCKTAVEISKSVGV